MRNQNWQLTQSQILTVLFWNLLESCKVNVPTLEVGPTLEIHVCHEDAGVEEIRSAVVDRGLESGPMGERERYAGTEGVK